MRNSTPWLGAVAMVVLITSGISFRELTAQEASKNLVEDFAKGYRSAVSDEERLQICISAINQGVIHEGSSVTNIDQLFGTRYAERLAQGKGPDVGLIFFTESQKSAEARSLASWSEELPIASGPGCPLGWHIVLQYDNHHAIGGYSLSNVWKVRSYLADEIVTPVTDRETLDELARRYRSAASEGERLQVCIAAINRGVIADQAPIENINRIFGTNYATPRFDKSAPESARSKISFGVKSNETGTTEPEEAWFIRFSYNSSGVIDSYYLSNVDR